MKLPLHITQYKRFVPYGTHPNPALFKLAKWSLLNEYMKMLSGCRIKISQKCWVSFMLKPISEISRR